MILTPQVEFNRYNSFDLNTLILLYCLPILFKKMLYNFWKYPKYLSLMF